MKNVFFSLLAALTGAAFAAPAIAKTSAPTSVKAWIGVWNCVSGKDKYTETFTPILGGKAMRVSITGPFASEGVAVYDASHKAWFYAYINGDGTYSAMNGPVTGSSIAFKQTFPPGVALDAIRLVSPGKYTSAFTMVANHKKVSAGEICTKSS